MVDAGGREHGGYRPHLDGVRGVAIGLVLLLHFAHPRALPGAGHVGVGLFFAPSGYLITGLLLDEMTSGRVDLGSFYVRRAPRLLPGLALMVACTAPLLAWSGHSVGRPAVAALSYTTNYAGIAGWLPGSGAFEQTWSLAIEEHFYLLWAPVLMLLARRGGSRAVLKRAVAGALVCLVFRLDVAFVAYSWTWVARGSFARGDALLAGCVAAAGRRDGFRAPRWLFLSSGAVVLALAFVLPSEGTGSVVTLAVGLGVLSWSCAAFVASLDELPPVLVRRALSTPPPVTVGVLSYSLYLWHYPLLAAPGRPAACSCHPRLVRSGGAVVHAGGASSASIGPGARCSIAEVRSREGWFQRRCMSR
jgi:peptidoglycan/LPS O-acetylase OafA/YrhL